MIEKIFDKIPYDALSGVKFIQMFLVAVGLAVVVGIGYYFVIKGPHNEEYASLEKKLMDTQTKLQQYQVEVAQKDTVTKDVATLAGTLVERKRHLPLPEELPALLNKMTDVAGFLGLKIMDFQMGAPADRDFYKKIPVTITFVGDYYRTVGFFDTMQSLLRLVNISDMKMNLQPIQQVGRDTDGERILKPVKRLQTSIQANTYAYIEGSEDK